tara:strand:- start:5404 stop:5694 length:291 start_codon:yes stop_codon:yes gene_type:complete
MGITQIQFQIFLRAKKKELTRYLGVLLNNIYIYIMNKTKYLSETNNTNNTSNKNQIFYKLCNKNSICIYISLFSFVVGLSSSLIYFIEVEDFSYSN